MRRRFFGEALEQRLQLSVGSGAGDAGPQFDDRAEGQTGIIAELLGKVDVGVPAPGEVRASDADDGVLFVDQLKGPADDRLVAVKVALPEPIVQHDDGLRLLTPGRIGGSEIAAQQRRNSEGGKGIAGGKVGNHVFRHVVASEGEVPLIPGGNVFDGVGLL
jgi:hypothetical protein